MLQGRLINELVDHTRRAFEVSSEAAKVLAATQEAIAQSHALIAEVDAILRSGLNGTIR